MIERHSLNEGHIVTDKTLEQIEAELKVLEELKLQKINEEREAVLEDVKKKIKMYRITKTELRGVIPVLRKTKPKGQTAKKP